MHFLRENERVNHGGDYVLVRPTLGSRCAFSFARTGRSFRLLRFDGALMPHADPCMDKRIGAMVRFLLVFFCVMTNFYQIGEASGMYFLVLFHSIPNHRLSLP